MLLNGLETSSNISSPAWCRRVQVIRHPGSARLVVFAALWLLACSPDTYGTGEIHNVLLVSIDTLRADHLGVSGFPEKITPHLDRLAEEGDHLGVYGFPEEGGHLGVYRFPKEITPHLDRLAEEGVRFELAIASNPMTLPSHVTLLTGTTPIAHGVHDNDESRLGPQLPTLAESLRDAGLRTAAFVAATVIGSHTGVARGFDSFDEVQRTDGVYYAQRPAGEVVQRVLEFVESQGKTRWFAFVHLFDPHFPYDPPEPYRTRFAASPYAGEIAYVDGALGLLFDALRAKGVLDTTLVIVSADHGESFGEHGEVHHSYFAYQTTQHVPLIIRAPGLGGGRLIPGVVGLHDVAPTTLSLLEIEVPPEMEGLDLSPVLRGEPLDLASRAVYCESYVPTKVGCNPIFALVGPRWKYIATTRPELYDLSEDPWEERNLVDAEPVRARELAGRLQARLESSRPGDALGPDEETQAQLAALGYLTGPIDATAAIDPTRPDPKDRLRAWDVLRRVDPQDERFEERGQRLKEVVRDFPDLIGVHRQLGGIARAERNWRRSIVHYELYQRLLEAGPGGGDPRLRSEARTLIGVARLEMGQRDRALEEFEEALRIDPSATHPLHNAAIALVRLGRVDDAVDKLTELLARDPDDQEIRSFRERLLAGDTSPFE
jgi:arylsulfatase A-like enzyme